LGDDRPGVVSTPGGQEYLTRTVFYLLNHTFVPTVLSHTSLPLRLMDILSCNLLPDSEVNRCISEIE